jgi:hypothetical protein
VSDILATAAEVLLVAGQATMEDWQLDGYQILDSEGRREVAVANTLADARFITNARTSAPALAAFVQRVDQYTRDLISANRAEANNARDDRAIGVLVGARALREHVGLPEVP